MGSKYNRLSTEERLVIASLLKAGMSLRGIAKELLRAPSTISREINRHFPKDKTSNYLWQQANNTAINRRSKCRKRKRLKCPDIEAYVRQKLALRWSPEQIAGRLAKDSSHLSISHEAIYQFIYTEAKEFIPLLPRSGRKRLKRSARRKRRIELIPQRKPLTERSFEANLREEFGHWEVDTVLSSKGKAALVVCTERKTRLSKIAKLPQKKALSLKKCVVSRFSQLPRLARKTITYDNGIENTKHLEINRALGTTSYFCTPYHSWEKGTVENTIGILRRYFPKATNFDLVTTQQVKILENKLNKTPRKCLNFFTPLEAFNNECCT